ncbi:hypothetical protein AB1M95_03750 [Sulfitobacter sp. LCG007]
MPIPSSIIALAAGLAVGASGAWGADYADPTWPCIQRKVDRLSPALMWQFPLPQTGTAADLPPDAAAFADKLALRRIDPESLAPEVESFARAHDGDPVLLGQVFSRTFDLLDRRRTRIIAGIGDFSLSQIRLSETIDATRLEMDRLSDAEDPDFDRMDALEEKLDWDQLIYSDRSQSITYLCETPQLIERRLFTIARMLGNAVKMPD